MASRVIFMGTPDFAVPSLQALLKAPDFDVVGVVTQPDRPAGRGKTLQPSPVKTVAVEAGLPVLQPEKLRAPGVLEQLAHLRPDLIVVAAFGQILRPAVLELPRFGCVNVHASLLPRWRGAAPIQAAIRAGDSETGVTIMLMDAGLDTGPMLKARSVPITPHETGQSLHDTLAASGGPLLLEALRLYLQGALVAQPQPDTGSTYAPMLEKANATIDWTRPAAEIERQVRAYHPWPGTITRWEAQAIKLLPSEGTSESPAAMAGDAEPGRVVLNDGRLCVGTGDGLYVVQRLQMPGRGPMEASAFLNGHREFVGARLLPPLTVV